MNKIKVSKETCPPSCEQIRFITSEIQKKIDPIKECEKGDNVESFIGNYIHMNLNSIGNGFWGPPANIHKYDEIVKPTLVQFLEKMLEYKQSKENVSLEVKYDPFDSVKETCIALLSQDVARVSIMFESNYYVLTNTNVRVTFFDQISALGKVFFTSLILFFQ